MGVKIRQKDGKWYVLINHDGKRKAKCVGDSKRAEIEHFLLRNGIAVFPTPERALKVVSKIQTYRRIQEEREA